jgi:hypothetical protein
VEVGPWDKNRRQLNNLRQGHQEDVNLIEPYPIAGRASPRCRAAAEQPGAGAGQSKAR